MASPSFLLLMALFLSCLDILRPQKISPHELVKDWLRDILWPAVLLTFYFFLSAPLWLFLLYLVVVTIGILDSGLQQRKTTSVENSTDLL